MKKCLIPIVFFTILGIICYVRTADINDLVGLAGLGVIFSLLDYWFLTEITVDEEGD